MEPIEKMTLDLPETAAGEVTKMYQQRRGSLLSYEETSISANEEKRVRLTFEIPRAACSAPTRCTRPRRAARV